MATSTHTIKLQSGTFEALEVEATRRRVAVDELADTMVREQLDRMQSGTITDALAALEKVSAQMPEVDAVRLIREGRDELVSRSSRWPSS